MKSGVVFFFIFLSAELICFFVYKNVFSEKPKVINPLSYKIFPTSTLSPTSTPTPTVTPIPPTPTITPTPRPVIAPADLDELFKKYSSQYSIDYELLKRIAKCESGFSTGVSAHGYAGLFQFSEVLWTQTRNLLNQNPDPNLRFSAEESIKTAAFMLSQGHLGIWPNCAK